MSKAPERSLSEQPWDIAQEHTGFHLPNIDSQLMGSASAGHRMPLSAQVLYLEYAPEGSFDCPLNVCCSKYGFCGTSEDFCNEDCQTGCDEVEAPSCSGPSSNNVNVGYYESWSHDLKCDGWDPERIDPDVWSHINYAFALIGDDHRMAQMNSYDVELYRRFTGLKGNNPGLKTYIAVGGWSAGGKPFSDMVASSENRATFIDSAISFMSLYAFDGIDIDWEYPAASDRDGMLEDTHNFVDFLKELKTACGTRYGITVTLPTSYWYLRGFDLPGMEPYVEWFNLMSYDIHGTWDGNSPYTQQVVQPHTNLTEIEAGLNLLWRNGVDPEKVVLGLAFYGRSFTLADSKCNVPGCAFSEGGKNGSCTNTAGILSNAEIQRVIKDNGLSPILDEQAAVKYMSWDSDQWVSYDDSETLTMKKKFADDHCLRGTMVWALDMADPATSDSESNLIVNAMAELGGDEALKHPTAALEVYQKNTAQNQVLLQAQWTDCAARPECPLGYSQIALGHGKIFDYDQHKVIADGCHGGGKGFNRALCVENNVKVDDCSWYGRPKGCKQTCPAGLTLVSQNSHIGGEKTGCRTGYYSSLCCRSFRAARLETCNNPGFFNKLSGGLGLQIRSGWSNVLGTAPECNARNNQFAAGWYHADGVPNLLPGYWEVNGRFVAARRPPYGEMQEPETMTCHATQTFYNTEVVDGKMSIRTCNYLDQGPACEHYRSVVSVNPWAQTLTCPPFEPADYRPIVSSYSAQHHSDWRAWISRAPRGALPRGKDDTCDRDEWPPHRFDGYNLLFRGQWIRYLSSHYNRAANGLVRKACDGVKSKVNRQGGPVNNYVCTLYVTTTFTLPLLSIKYRYMPNDPADPDGLTSNWCQPIARVTKDPGFALLKWDNWYKTGTHTDHRPLRYAASPVSPAGVQAPRPEYLPPQNDFFDWDELPQLSPEDLVVDDGNTTRLKSDKELWEQYDILRCKNVGCKEEIEEMGLEAPEIVAEMDTSSFDAGHITESIPATIVIVDVTPGEKTPEVIQEASQTSTERAILTATRL